MSNISSSGYNQRGAKKKIKSTVSLLWMEVNSEQCSFKPGPSYHFWHWHDFQLFSNHPTTVNVQTWKNHYSYKKVVYLSDSRWLITVEAVSMATSSLAAKGKWDFHPISFEMALEREGSLTCRKEKCFVKLNKPQDLYPTLNITPFNNLSAEIRPSVNFSSGNTILVILNVDFHAWRYVISSVYSRISNQWRSRQYHLVPCSVTNLHPEMSEGDTRGIWEKAHANLLGERPTPKLILHLDGFTLWLPEETWTWELGAIQSIRFTHSSMCLPTCWGESRQPDEAAIPPRSIIKGKCLSARSMCYKLRCTRFLQKETERLMMQLWNVKHTYNSEPAITQHVHMQTICRCVYICVPLHEDMCVNKNALHTQKHTQKHISSRGVQDILRADTDNNTNLLNVTQPTHTYTPNSVSHCVQHIYITPCLHRHIHSLSI